MPRMYLAAEMYKLSEPRRQLEIKTWEYTIRPLLRPYRLRYQMFYNVQNSSAVLNCVKYSDK
jgi:anthranilate phosphoribosyltransferase